MDVDVEPEVASEQLRGLFDELINTGDKERLREALGKLFDDISKATREVAHLRVRVLQLTQRAFGKSSEKIDPNQLRLALEELRADEFARQDAAKPAVDPDAPASSPPPETKKSLKGRHPGRAPLPEHLPREERRHATPVEERRAWTLRPLWKLIDERVLRSWVIQSDDTGLLVLDKQKKGGSRRGRLWANVGDARFVAYHYSPDWRHEHPVRFLAGCAGFLQTDGYKGYEALCDGKGGLAIRAGCFMHARRYFVKALQAGEPEAARPVEIIRALYAVERASKEAGEDPDARYARRQEHSVSLLDELGDWRLEHAGRYPPKSPMGKALTYLHGQWESLGVFLVDGRIELDNGGAERALRGIAVGRRNWLFAGSDAGGERAAILYSIIESAKLHGIEPFAYLRDVLEKLGAGWPMRRLEELMPDRWAAERSIAPPELRVTQLSSAV